jgi:hypothetical protein
MTPEREGLETRGWNLRTTRVSDLSGTALDNPWQEIEITAKVEILPMGLGRGGRGERKVVVLKR